MPLNEIAEKKSQQALKTREFETVASLLMTAYGDEIYRFCKSMLATYADAQDVLQTVFVQAFYGLEKFESKSSFRTWLYVIARNRCLDEIKKAKRFDARVKFTEQLPEPTVNVPSDDNSYNDPFIRAVLKRCMEKLSDAVKAAVLLRYQSEHSYEEAAIILQQKAGTLQARVARAMPALRRCVEENGVSL